jgi:L-glyceraldehyde 3-phosphate reductase
MLHKPSEYRYDSMLYNRCGKSGIKLPAVSLGLWHNFGSVDVYENGKNIILSAFDSGITHFDLANNYGPEPGSAEENFGKVLHHHLHDLSRRAASLVPKLAIICGRDLMAILVLKSI